MVKIKKYAIKNRGFLFFVSYMIFMIFMTLSASFYYKYFINEIKLIIFGCCLVLVLGEIINTRLNNNEWKGLLICLTLFMIVFAVSKGATENAVAAIFLYMYAAKNISFDEIAKFSFHLLFLLLCFIIGSSFVGIIDNILLIKNGRNRWCLGFRYALYAPSLYFNIACLWVYLNRDRKQKGFYFKTCILLLLNCWLYNMTNSRITFFMTCIVLLIPLIRRPAMKSQP